MFLRGRRCGDPEPLNQTIRCVLHPELAHHDEGRTGEDEDPGDPGDYLKYLSRISTAGKRCPEGQRPDITAKDGEGHWPFRAALECILEVSRADRTADL